MKKKSSKVIHEAYIHVDKVVGIIDKKIDELKEMGLGFDISATIILLNQLKKEMLEMVGRMEEENVKTN